MQLSTQQKHSVATDKAGRYVLVDLPPGEYELTIDADGFQHAVQRAVVLHSGDHTRRDFSLAVASSNHLIEVQPVPSVMQVESAELMNVIDNHQMVGLPLKNRQFLELTLLSPGIVNSPGGTRGDSSQETGAVINVLGNRAGHNLFLVDGANTTDEYFNNVVLSPSPETIQEVNVEMAEYSAEFGGKSGAVINVTTRGGSNKLYGKVYEFIRNDFFEARNCVAPTGVLTPFHENQFGAVLDGPIVKNRTFFMASYDGERLRQTLSQLYSVPTAAQRAGNLAGLSAVRDPLTGVAVSGNNLNNDPNFSTSNPSTAAALALLNLLPLPTGAGTASNLQGIAPKSIDMNQYSARIDHRFGANDTAFVRASYVDPNARDPFGSNALNETLLPGFGRILRSPSTNVVASESHAFSPKFINEARASWLIVTGGQKDPNAGNPSASSYGLRGTTSNLADVGYPQVSLSGLFSTIGTATGFNTRVDHNFEITDNVTLIRGRHEIKLGPA